MSFREFLRCRLGLGDLPELDEVFVTKDGTNITILREAKSTRAASSGAFALITRFMAPECVTLTYWAQRQRNRRRQFAERESLF
ncbi:MAG TPA: hypothetical protein VM620_10495 [Hyphomicrobium sp.]|nr:hypothetical protein [Hyphomicrobium sp.]